MYEAAAIAIKDAEKGAFGHVTKSGDLEMTDRALPVHPGQSAPANLAFANYEPAIDPPRGFNAREPHVATLPRDGKPYGNFRDVPGRLQVGGEYCSGGKAEAIAAVILVEFTME